MEALSGTIRIIDIVLAFLVLWGGYSAFKKGFIVELIETLTFIVSLGLIFWFVTEGINTLETNYLGTTNKFIKIAIFVLIYFIIIIILNKFSKWLQKKIDYSILDSLDNFAAFALGCFKYMIFLGVIIMGLELINITPGEDAKNDSFMYGMILKFNEGMIEFGGKVGLHTDDVYETIKGWLSSEE